PRSAASLADHLRVRPGSRVRLLVRPEPDPAVRGLPSPDLAARLQRGGGAGAAPGARAAGAAPRPALPVRGRGADGNDHPVGGPGPHGLALAARALRPAAPVPV